jgi:hypothetical protein
MLIGSLQIMAKQWKTNILTLMARPQTSPIHGVFSRTLILGMGIVALARALALKIQRTYASMQYPLIQIAPTSTFTLMEKPSIHMDGPRITRAAFAIGS